MQGHRSNKPEIGGVWFYGRIGCFLRRPCIAVCAEDQFVILKYDLRILKNERRIGQYEFKVLKKYKLNGSPLKGITLFVPDLHSMGLNQNSPVLGPDDLKGD